MMFKELFVEVSMYKMIYNHKNYFTFDKSLADAAVEKGAELQSDSDWKEMKSDWKAMEGNLRNFSHELTIEDLK